MKLVTAFILLLPVHSSQYVYSKEHMVYEQIITLSPLPDKLSIEYANTITKFSDIYNLDPNLVVSIIFVESKFKYFEGKHDFGPMQVNKSWFKRLGIKKEDLLSINGGIGTGTYILKLVQDESDPNDKCWWSVYNTRTPHKRIIYENKVLQVMKRIGASPTCRTKMI
jgi:hypothetical protein